LSFIVHALCKIIVEMIFTPFLFGVDAGTDDKDSTFSNMSEQLKSRSTKKEAMWRQSTLLAHFSSPEAKQRINTAAVAVVQAMLAVVQPFLGPDETDDVRNKIRAIVKLATETWRYSRLERERIYAIFPPNGQTAEEDSKVAFWPAQSFDPAKYPVNAVKPLFEGKPDSNGEDRTLVLRLLPVIRREPIDEAFKASAAEKNDRGSVYSYGLALYDDAPPVIARLNELRQEARSLVPAADAVADSIYGDTATEPAEPPAPAEEVIESTTELEAVTNEPSPSPTSDSEQTKDSSALDSIAEDGESPPSPTPNEPSNPPPDAPESSTQGDIDELPNSMPQPSGETSPGPEPHCSDPDEDGPPDEETPSDEPPADEPPTDEPPVDEPPADEAPADEPPTDESPTDESPADEPPTDESPADQPPADEPEDEDSQNEETPNEESPNEGPPDSEPNDESLDTRTEDSSLETSPAAPSEYTRPPPAPYTTEDETDEALPQPSDTEPAAPSGYARPIPAPYHTEESTIEGLPPLPIEETIPEPPPVVEPLPPPLAAAPFPELPQTPLPAPPVPEMAPPPPPPSPSGPGSTGSTPSSSVNNSSYMLIRGRPYLIVKSGRRKSSSVPASSRSGSRRRAFYVDSLPTSNSASGSRQSSAYAPSIGSSGSASKHRRSTSGWVNAHAITAPSSNNASEDERE
jgi:hypothetical protein